MKHVLWVAACMFGIGVGCVGATVAQQFAVPSVRAGTNPQRWEYYCAAPGGGEITKLSNRLGAQAWEMVAAAGGKSSELAGLATVWCFKRPL